MEKSSESFRILDIKLLLIGTGNSGKKYLQINGQKILLLRMISH